MPRQGLVRRGNAMQGWLRRGKGGGFGRLNLFELVHGLPVPSGMAVVETTPALLTRIIHTFGVAPAAVS